jgi:hypothetical protein
MGILSAMLDAMNFGKRKKIEQAIGQVLVRYHFLFYKHQNDIQETVLTLCTELNLRTEPYGRIYSAIMQNLEWDEDERNVAAITQVALTLVLEHHVLHVLNRLQLHQSKRDYINTMGAHIEHCVSKGYNEDPLCLRLRGKISTEEAIKQIGPDGRRNL